MMLARKGAVLDACFLQEIGWLGWAAWYGLGC
jgi:hypothetical protein